MAEIFAVVRRGVLAELPPQAPPRVAVDDSLLRKTGLRIPVVAWRRDPLGPPPRGRPRRYGAPHSMRIKHLPKILWRTAGLGQTL